MISIKNSLTDLDRQAKELENNRRFARRCLQLWQGSLRAVEDHVFPLFPEAARKAVEDWQQVHCCVQEDTPEDVLDSTPRLVERVLHNFAIGVQAGAAGGTGVDQVDIGRDGAGGVFDAVEDGHL